MKCKPWDKECEKQSELLSKFLSEGRELIPSKTNNELYGSIGEVKRVGVTLKGFTPKKLAIFYLEGEENDKAFHLVRPDLLLKYNPQLSPEIKEGLILNLDFVIGVRAVGEKSFVIGLRLPR